MESNPVLVDTSVWIDFLRGDHEASGRLDPLLADRRARTTGPVFVEVVSGARTKAEQANLRALLLKISWLEPDGPIWERLADIRFGLSRLGKSCNIPDLMIALAAADSGAKLLTRDRDFESIATVVPFDLDVF